MQPMVARCEKREDLERIISQLEAKNEQLQEVATAAWGVVDGMYGADADEAKLPIELIPDNRVLLLDVLMAAFEELEDVNWKNVR